MSEMLCLQLALYFFLVQNGKNTHSLVRIQHTNCFYAHEESNFALRAIKLDEILRICLDSSKEYIIKVSDANLHY